MSEQRELSLRLDAILEMVGASEHMRKMHQRMASIAEIMQACYFRRAVGHNFNVHVSGSFYEGTVTPDIASDVDIIACYADRFVVPHRLMAGPGWFLQIVREDWTSLGFVKLQWMWDGRPLTAYDVEASEDVAFDREGRACVNRFTSGNMHGPAEMRVDEHGRHVQDNVRALRCAGIPLFATDWITRHRPYGWPSQQLIDELKMMGCLFVGVGHFNSPERYLECRLSFSLQERVLMKSLNQTQHKIYILLKMTKKNILENIIKRESLSSYHCKTCLFYMIETSPAGVWVPEILINCLLGCLKLLLKWVRNKWCPSFFLKDSNLFDKEGFSTHLGTLERLLGLLLQMGHKFLYLLQSDSVGEILSHGELRLHRPLCDVIVCRYISDIKLRCIGDIASTARTPPKLSSQEQDALSLYMSELEGYEHTNGVQCYTQEDAQTVQRYISPWLNLSIALEYAARVVTCPDTHEGKELMKKVDIHLQEARNTDLVNVRFAQATILLRMEKLEECLLLLQELENCWTWRAITYCTCTHKTSAINIRDDQQHREVHSSWRDMPIRKLMQKYVAFCVIFTRSQLDLVPHPLRYEMYRSLYTQPGSRDKIRDTWFDSAAVDGNVYLCLLQYLVCSKLNRASLKQIAIDNLASLVQHDANELGHKETAYNILGWMYLQEDRVADAIRCFQQSWNVRPHHNAAKFHVLVESFRQAQQRARAGQLKSA